MADPVRVPVDLPAAEPVDRTAQPVAALRDVGVLLGGRPVLRGIDLTVRRGEVLAVLGANGSGKSTLVRAMLGLTPVHRGTVDLFGTPIAQFRDHARLGYVPQRVTATAGVPASVHEVTASGLVAHRRFWQPARRGDRRRVHEALESVGLADRSRDGLSTLSGGQQQRVLIARALVGEPELLVLDEPTAGVDLRQQQVVADLLARLVARGTTVVVVAHETGPMERLLTRSVVMRDGRVAYDGPVLASFLQADHDHHHPSLPAAHPDYAPPVRSPLETGAASAEEDPA